MTDPQSRPRRLAVVVALLLAVPLALVACSSGATGPDRPTAAPSTCTGTPGQQLVVLADDRRSQNSENVLPLVRTSAVAPPVTQALDGVSRALSQDELQGLNRAVTVDRTDETAAAQEFVDRLGLRRGLGGGSGPLVVGAADFSESGVLADVYADVLTAAGYRASVRRFPSRELLEPALEAGAVQVTPEYAATLTTFLAARAGAGARPANRIDRTLAVLRPLAGARGLTVLEPAAAANANAFAVTKQTADALGVTTLSGLAGRCPGGVSFGGPAECPQRPFCQQALERTYGLRITRFLPLDADGPATRQALNSGAVLLAEVFSSDADVVPAGG